jgi:hypothetical protein
MWLRSLSVGALAVFVAFAAAAQDAPLTNIRGKIQKVDGKTITIKSRDGTVVPVTMADNFGVLGVVKAKLSDIKENDFVGIAASPGKDGKLHAEEVLIFPEAARGTGEGHYDWDLKPNTKMTNANVEQTVAGVEGPVLSVKYKDGEKKVLVTPETAVVTYVVGDKSDLKPGIKIFVGAGKKQADGTVQTPRVTYGKDGLTPPM